MKIKNFIIKKTINLILAITFVVTAVFGSMFFINNPISNSKLFAANNFDAETKIYREEAYISVELWDALQKFYNDNKTSEMPEIQKDDEDALYLTIDLFTDFPVSNLDLSNQAIKSIKNLSEFDLSSFTEINLSNNEIDSIGEELKGLDWLEILDLSNNQLSEFSVENLSQESTTNNLTTLDISGNKIVNCDLSTINNAEIFAINNEITLQSLTLPTNTDVVVWLSNNYIIGYVTSNENIYLGFQGVKNNIDYSIGTTVAFYGLEELDEITLYSLTKNGTTYDETEIKVLTIGETHTFGIGHYKVEFNENYDDILFYVLPNAPTLKMFKNNTEIELTHLTTSPVTIKLYGDEGAQFGYIRTIDGKTNFVDIGDTIEIKKEGVYNIEVYQYVDGYLSFKTTFYLEYRAPKTMSWVYFVIAVGGFVLIGYLVMRFLPQITSLNLGKKNNKDKLD